jgi:hypothetical protein
MTTTAMAAGQGRAEEGQGAVRLAICAAGVPAVEMACRIDQGMSVLEWSNIQANWELDIGGAMGGDGGDKVGEAEDVLGTIASSGGSGGTLGSARGERQRRLPKPPPPPLPASRASLAKDAMARLLLSLSQLLSIGVSKLILTSLNFLELVLP